MATGEELVRRDELDWFAYKVRCVGVVDEFWTRAQEYASVERTHQSYLQSEARRRSSSLADANEVARKALQRELQEIATAHKISKFAESMFVAISVSLGIGARDYVFVVRRYDEEGVRKVRCRLRGQLPRIVRSRPTFLLDGTASLDLLKVVFRDIPFHVREVPVRLGAYHLTQYYTDTFSPSMLTSAKGTSRRAHIRRMHALIRQLSRKYKALGRKHECRIEGRVVDVLVICSLKIQLKLEELELPDNVKVEHYHDIRGLDAYREVPCGVIVGRPEPPEWALEAQTETLHYDNPDVIAVTRAQDWRSKHGRASHDRYRSIRKVQMADGRVAEFECEAHPDPHVEVLRQLLVNAEVCQAVHRLRLLDRTDANPAEIHLFSDIDVGIPVHELKRWVDAGETETEMMITCGLVLTNAEFAMHAYHDIFQGLGVRMVQRLLSQQIGMLPTLRDWVQVEFRVDGKLPDGRAAYKQTAFVAPTEPNPGELIAARLGCAIEWRSGGVVDWQRAAPTEVGIQDGEQSLPSAVDEVLTRAVSALNEKSQSPASCERASTPDRDAAA